MKVNIIAKNPSAGLGLIITKQVSQYKLGPLAIKNIYSDMRYKIQNIHKNTREFCCLPSKQLHKSLVDQLF